MEQGEPTNDIELDCLFLKETGSGHSLARQSFHEGHVHTTTISKGHPMATSNHRQSPPDSVQNNFQSLNENRSWIDMNLDWMNGYSLPQLVDSNSIGNRTSDHSDLSLSLSLSQFSPLTFLSSDPFLSIPSSSVHHPSIHLLSSSHMDQQFPQVENPQPTCDNSINASSTSDKMIRPFQCSTVNDSTEIHVPEPEPVSSHQRQNPIGHQIHQRPTSSNRDQFERLFSSSAQALSGLLESSVSSNSLASHTSSSSSSSTKLTSPHTSPRLAPSTHSALFTHDANFTLRQTSIVVQSSKATAKKKTRTNRRRSLEEAGVSASCRDCKSNIAVAILHGSKDSVRDYSIELACCECLTHAEFLESPNRSGRDRSNVVVKPKNLEAFEPADDTQKKYSSRKRKKLYRFSCEVCRQHFGSGSIWIGESCFGIEADSSLTALDQEGEEFIKKGNKKEVSSVLDMKMEFQCISCRKKYALCSSCGTGSRFWSGKFRPVDLFSPRRKTCTLSHSRIGSLSKANYVIFNESDLPLFQQSRGKHPVIDKCKDIHEQVLLSQLLVVRNMELYPSLNSSFLKSRIQTSWTEHCRSFFDKTSEQGNQLMKKFVSISYMKNSAAISNPSAVPQSQQQVQDFLEFDNVSFISCVFSIWNPTTSTLYLCKLIDVAGDPNPNMLTISHALGRLLQKIHQSLPSGDTVKHVYISNLMSIDDHVPGIADVYKLMSLGMVLKKIGFVECVSKDAPMLATGSDNIGSHPRDKCVLYADGYNLNVVLQEIMATSAMTSTFSF